VETGYKGLVEDSLASAGGRGGGGKEVQPLPFYSALKKRREREGSADAHYCKTKTNPNAETERGKERKNYLTLTPWEQEDQAVRVHPSEKGRGGDDINSEKEEKRLHEKEKCAAI